MPTLNDCLKKYETEKAYPLLSFEEKAKLGKLLAQAYHDQDKIKHALRRKDITENGKTWTVLVYPKKFVPFINLMIDGLYSTMTTERKERLRIPVKKNLAYSAKRSY